MSRAGFVIGFLVMVQGAVGQTPVVVNLYDHLGDFSTSSTDFTDIPEWMKTVTVPAGMAVITWSLNVRGPGGGLNANSEIQPVIGPNAPTNGVRAYLPLSSDTQTYSGSWVTPVDAGEIVVKLQVKRLDANGASISTSQQSMTWTLVVYPTFADNVPAIGDIGLAVMVLGLIAAGGFVLRRRGALVE